MNVLGVWVGTSTDEEIDSHVRDQWPVTTNHQSTKLWNFYMESVFSFISFIVMAEIVIYLLLRYESPFFHFVCVFYFLLSVLAS